MKNLPMPIIINADNALSTSLGISTRALSKLEAWANFATLKANWYGDTEQEIQIKITLVSEALFEQLKTKADKQWQQSEQSLLRCSEHKFDSFVLLPLTSDAASMPEAECIDYIRPYLLTFLNTFASNQDLDEVID